MLQVGKLSGIVKAWAQNGPIYDVALVGAAKIQKIHHQDMAMTISKLIIEKDKAEKKQAKRLADVAMEKEFADEAKFDEAKAKEKDDKAALEAAAEELADTEAEIHKEFEVGSEGKPVEREATEGEEEEEKVLAEAEGGLEVDPDPPAGPTGEPEMESDGPEEIDSPADEPSGSDLEEEVPDKIKEETKGEEAKG